MLVPTIKSVVLKPHYNVRGMMLTLYMVGYMSALEIATKVGVDESMPRISRGQQHRSNVPSSGPSEYYKRVLTIPTLDHLITEMDGRFHHDSASVVCQIMPSTLAESEEVVTSSMISDLIHMYEDYLPAPGSMDTELHCWGDEMARLLHHFALVLRSWQS